MQVSDVAALPIRLGAAARHARLFHPDGVLAEGTLERVAPAGEGLPMVSCDVVARVSKGIGLPDRLPDIAGLAWRMPPPQDLAVAHLGRAVGIDRRQQPRPPRANRLVVRHHFLQPDAVALQRRVWWVRARLVTDIGNSGLSLDTVRHQIDSDGIEFDIEQAAGTGRFQRLARLTLAHVDPSCDDIAFDPTMHSDPDVQLAPLWLSGFRRAAYRRSREGRP